MDEAGKVGERVVQPCCEPVHLSYHGLREMPLSDPTHEICIVSAGRPKSKTQFEPQSLCVRLCAHVHVHMGLWGVGYFFSPEHFFFFLNNCKSPISWSESKYCSVDFRHAWLSPA